MRNIDIKLNLLMGFIFAALIASSLMMGYRLGQGARDENVEISKNNMCERVEIKANQHCTCDYQTSTNFLCFLTTFDEKNNVIMQNSKGWQI